MTHRRNITLAAALGLLLSSFAAAGASAQTIVERAANAGQFDILVGALRKTGLAETLEGPGPFTVFAPTDAAFAKLSDAEQTALLNPENRGQLEELLSFHVVRGEFTSGDLMGIAGIVETLMGEPLAFDATDTPVNVGGAMVSSTDIEADNGVIHVVDSVILPPELAR